MIVREDLARLSRGGSEVSSIPAGDRSEVIGQVASVRMGKGTMPQQRPVDDESVVGPDESIVSVRVAPGDLPNPDLRDGQFVKVVRVGRSGDVNSNPVEVATAKVMHLEVLEESQGETSVSLLVPVSTARLVADASASNEARLVLVNDNKIGEGENLDGIVVAEPNTEGGG